MGGLKGLRGEILSGFIGIFLGIKYGSETFK